MGAEFGEFECQGVQRCVRAEFKSIVVAASFDLRGDKTGLGVVAGRMHHRNSSVRFTVNCMRFVCITICLF